MRETWVRSLCWEDPLKKEMATHSSILAWRIPWMEEPNHLTSQGPWLQMPSQQRLGFQHMKIRGKQTFSPLHGSYSNSIFNFLGSYHTVLHSGYTILLSYQQRTRVFIFPYPGQQLLFSVFFFFLAVAILVGVTYYLTVILTCVSLINNDGEHFFTCSLVICISSSEKCLVKSIAHFKIRLL